jgi:N-acetyl-alpha-D-muramate 1-phosphate uridylyltransferase
MPLPVAILAGGLATRLRPVTESIPKAMVEINGEPFIAHQLRLLSDRGIRRVVLCVAYLADSIQEFVGDGSAFGMDVGYSYDGAELRGTAGAIRRALPQLGEAFFVLYGDSYLPCDYAAVQNAFETGGKDALMTVVQNDGQWDSSNVEFHDGIIVKYDKKDRTPAMRHIDYGLGVFHPGVFAALPVEGSHDLARVYQDLLAQGRLAGYDVGRRFYEIGSFAGIAELSRLLAAGTPL